MNCKVIILLLISMCSGIHTIAQEQSKEAAAPIRNVSKVHKRVLYGVASFYANKFHGRRTASGDTYLKDKLTAACNQLPLRTWIKVTNLRNHRSVIVKINDRLHPKNKRLIDLSSKAAQLLGYSGRGLTRVRVEVLRDFGGKNE